MTRSNNVHWWQNKSHDMYCEWAMWFVVVFWMAILAVLIGGGVTIGQAVSNHANRVDCAKYSKATGLETRFAYYGFWHNECILIGPNGVELPDNRTINNVGN